MSEYQVEYRSVENFARSAWTGGQTTELLLLPEGASYKERNFLARLSTATLACSSSTFTYLQGIRRFITPITNPFLLEVNGNKPLLLSPFDVFEFSGEDAVKSYGMSRDVGLMLNEKKASGWMKVFDKRKRTPSRNGKRGNSEVERESEEIVVHLNMQDILWIFSDCQNTVRFDCKDYNMEALSLLVVQHVCNDVRISFSGSVVYGIITPRVEA